MSITPAMDGFTWKTAIGEASKLPLIPTLRGATIRNACRQCESSRTTGRNASTPRPPQLSAPTAVCLASAGESELPRWRRRRALRTTPGDQQVVPRRPGCARGGRESVLAVRAHVGARGRAGDVGCPAQVVSLVASSGCCNCSLGIEDESYGVYKAAVFPGPSRFERASIGKDFG